MKRVLFVDDVPDYGGHQATAVAAARHLAANGIDVISAFPASNERLHQAWLSAAPAVQLIAMDVALTRWQPFLSPFGVAAEPVRTVIRDVDPDVVVAVQGTIVQSNRVVEQSRRLGIPVVSFVPMGIHFHHDRWLRLLVARMLERHHYRRPDAFITISEHSRRELVEGGARAPIRVVYCGAAIERLERLPREDARLRMGLHRYTVAIIGRVTFGMKGHDVILRALPALPGIDLLVVGDGPDDARLDALAKTLGVSDRVRRMPWLENPGEVYSAVDLVVIPSRFEGLPLVALEAMFFELPVVAADMGAMREILPGDWVFPAGDAGALAATILRVRDTDQRAILARHRTRIVEELNEAAYARRFQDALEEIHRTIRRN